MMNSESNRNAIGAWAAAALLVAAGAGCGGRPALWATPVETPPTSFSLQDAVAIVDRPADRVVLATVGSDQSLTTTEVPVGRDVVNAAALPDGSKLVIVSAGYRARLGDQDKDESPSLTVIDRTGKGDPSVRMDLGAVLTDPLSGLSLDPEGRWAVLYAGDKSGPGGLVENPNELVIVDLTQPIGADNPTPRTLQSFGGRPVRLTFTPTLSLPTGMQRLLIIESDQDVSLLELENPKKPPEITVPLTSGNDTRRLQPAGVVVDDGDPARNDDALVGIRLSNDPSVITLQLEPSSSDNGFKPTVNLTDVGGVPSDIAFVRTDGGLRLAALVPGTQSAVLVDPVTSLTTQVSLPASYTRLSLVTSAPAAGGAPAPATATDIGLLWNAAAGADSVAFWALGQTAGQPYRSIETLPLGTTVSAIFDVPMPNQGLKVLQAAQSGFYVLDLQTRTAAPLVTQSARLSMLVSPTGDRVWTFTPDGLEIAATDLLTKHPKSLVIDRPASAVHEIATGGGGRALVVLHGQGNIGATVFDAAKADDQTRRLYAGLLTEGDYHDHQ
ncbi:MAG TPA: hypothetical protein VMU50_01325 [Polyangia bacterium]|nr:hypothetical protein [Polyangia bacterium]